MKMITIRNYLTIACLLCALAIQAQNTYQLSAFKLLTQVEKADTNQRVLSKGISVEFRYLPLAIHKDLLRFEVQFGPWVKRLLEGNYLLNTKFRIV